MQGTLFALPQAEMQATAKPQRLHGVRILVVEDCTDIREVFTILLEAEGANVVATGTGQQAEEIATQAEFDFLLTDLGLPDVPGDVLIQRILDHGKSRPRVLVVTGFGEPHTSRARQAGAEVVLTKPVEWDSVLSYLGAFPGAVAA